MCVYNILTLQYAWLIRNGEHWHHEPRPVVSRLWDFWVWLRLNFQDLFYNSFSFASSPLFLHENDIYYLSVWKRILKYSELFLSGNNLFDTCRQTLVGNIHAVISSKHDFQCRICRNVMELEGLIFVRFHYLLEKRFLVFISEKSGAI